MDDRDHCIHSMMRCARLRVARHRSPPPIRSSNSALTYRPLAWVIAGIVLSSSLLAGGCSAAAQSLSSSTFAVRIVPGARCVQRIEVHLHPARNLGRATLEAQAHGWRIHPRRYVFKSLSPQARARSPSPQGPYADHPYQLRTFLLEPAGASPAPSVQLRLRSGQGILTRKLTLDLSHCPVQGRE